MSRDASETPFGFAGTQGATPAYAGGQCSRLGTSGVGLGGDADVRAGVVVVVRVVGVAAVCVEPCDNDGAAPDRAPAAEHALISAIATTTKAQPARFTGSQSHTG
jgi:hypothetical protein